MLFDSQIQEVVAYQKLQDKLIKDQVERLVAKDIDLSVSHVNILSGIRRSGKSTLLKQLAAKIENCYFMSFEDPRLVNFEVNDFFKLEKIFRENYENGVFFFDEIQNVPGWERYVRVLHDKGEKVLVTGSNASLLSKELGTSLTGRQLTYEIYPFSYEEFLNYKDLKSDIKSFETYLYLGGFPEYLQMGKRDVHLNLFNDILYRDIVARFGIRNTKVVKELAVFLATNIGKEFSYNKLAVNFNLGSVNTVLSYMAHFEDSYLFFSIPRFCYSLKQQVKNPKKVYAIDTGLVGNISMSFSKNKGRLLENLVFIELKRRRKELAYFRNKNECDFVVSDQGVVEAAIQVCFELNSDNLQREMNGLVEAMNELQLKKGLILTFDQKDKMMQSDLEIDIIPVKDWLLGH